MSAVCEWKKKLRRKSVLNGEWGLQWAPQERKCGTVHHSSAFLFMFELVIKVLKSAQAKHCGGCGHCVAGEVGGGNRRGGESPCGVFRDKHPFHILLFLSLTQVGPPEIIDVRPGLRSRATIPFSWNLSLSLLFCGYTGQKGWGRWWRGQGTRCCTYRQEWGEG